MSVYDCPDCDDGELVYMSGPRGRADAGRRCLSCGLYERASVKTGEWLDAGENR